MPNKRQGRAFYHWFAEDDTPQERKLLLKLDLLIIPYAFLGFWINYIDASNINNAWVAGLSDDLNFHGNQLVDFQTINQVGSVLGQLPLIWLFPRVPMNWLVPGIEVFWGIFTLLQYRATSFAEMMAYRFFIGFFEAPFFIGVHYVLGSWYRADELGRRGGLFYVGLNLGSLTAGLIQSSASAHLDGVAGLAGWRWMFIIVSLMTFAVALAGFFVWPGTPDIPNRLFLSEEDLQSARKRLEDNGNGTISENLPKLTPAFLRTVFTSWKIYFLTIWNILFWDSDPQPWGGYLLWIKSLNRYSNADVNRIGASAPGLGMLYVLFINFSSDLWLGRTAAIVLAHVVNVVSMTILVIWNVPMAAKWFAFNIYYFDIGMSSVLYGWANDILRHNKQERALVLVFMNTIPTAIRAWIGLLVFKTVEAPRFTKGYSFCLACSVLLIGFTFIIRHKYKVQEKQVALDLSRSSGVVEEIDYSQQSPKKGFGSVEAEPVTAI